MVTHVAAQRPVRHLRDLSGPGVGAGPVRLRAATLVRAQEADPGFSISREVSRAVADRAAADSVGGSNLSQPERISKLLGGPISKLLGLRSVLKKK